MMNDNLDSKLDSAAVTVLSQTDYNHLLQLYNSIRVPIYTLHPCSKDSGQMYAKTQ